MEIQFIMIEVKTKVYPSLKAHKRTGDNRQQLYLVVRIKRNKVKIDDFKFYVQDYGEPIYVHKDELKSGTIIGHEKSIRYNELISFLKRQIQEIAKEELTSKTILNRDHFRDLVQNSVKSNFNAEFIAKIGKQNITFKSSGYNFDEPEDEPDTENNGKKKNKVEIEFEVDKRAVEAIKGFKLPTEPKVDPLGQVDLDDIDAGDIELMLINEDQRIKAEAEQLRISKLTTEERYSQKEYDTQNIFELLASIYYEPKLSSTYDKIIIRLYEYRFYNKPKEHVRDYDEKWVEDFFRFLWQHGYTVLSTVKFDPLKFDPTIFVDKPIKKYKVDNYYKQFEIIQTISNYFANRGLLRHLNFKRINLEDICGQEQSEDGSRQEHALIKSEMDKLFFFLFNPKDLPDYQKIFDEEKIEKGNGKVKFKNLKIEIRDLEIARDMFCLQTFVGGLRGYKDLMTLNFHKDDKTVSFNVKKSKNKLWVNPYNIYISIIAKDYKNILPKLNFPYSQNSLEVIYRMLCKTIAKIIPLKRLVKTDEELQPLYEHFLPYVARKTFSQIASEEFEWDDIDVMRFTGHKVSGGESVLRKNYLNKGALIKKRNLAKDFKLPKGKTTNTKRSLLTKTKTRNKT